MEEDEKAQSGGGIVTGGGAPPPLTFGLDSGLAALGAYRDGLADAGLTAVDEDGEGPPASPEDGGAAAAGSVDFAEGGEVDFASRYARTAIDVPATLDSMTDGIMETSAISNLYLGFFELLEGLFLVLLIYGIVLSAGLKRGASS